MRLPKPRLSHGIVCLAGLNAVSAASFETRFSNVTWDDANWRITTTYLDQGHYQSRMSLSNGYLGISVAAVGPFFEVDTPVNGDNINGWPLFDQRQAFATIAGFYDYQERTNGTNYPWLYQYGGESVISGVPHWSGLLVEADGQILNASVDPSSISGFSSTLDIRAGLLTWGYSWTPGTNGSAIQVEYSMFVHKLLITQAVVQLKLTASRDVNVTVYDVLDGDGAKRTDFVQKGFETGTPAIWTAVTPNNLSNITAYVYSTLNVSEGVDLSLRKQVTDDPRIFGGNQSSIAQSVPVSLVAGKTITIAKFIGAASTDAFSATQSVASSTSCNGAAAGYADLLRSHMQEWATVMPADSVDSYHMPNGTLPDDPNIQELQITSVTNPFHILQNTVSQNAIAAVGNVTNLDVNSIPVCGLGADCYAGMIFWDAEIWMAPGLQVSHPYAMKQIVGYRQKQFAQAKENIKMAYTSSQNETGRFTEGGAVFPWTSSRYGNCTGTGPCFDYEYHINGDIGLELRNFYIATGNGQYFRDNLLPISNAIAYFYGELLEYNGTTGFYELKNATDPDEYANNVDSPGFTIALVQKHLNETNMLNSWFGLPVNNSWYEKSAKTHLPINEEANIIMEYATMNGSISVKQADVVLLDDILDYENPYAVSDLDYYAAKQSPYGPGMTYGVFSIVASEISPSGCSDYTYDLYSSQPYVRAPWFQFSEQLLDDYEANGGTHPAFPFLTGMGGANRVAIFGYLGLRMMIDRLDIDPVLPPQIPYLTYRTFYWQGHAISAKSNSTHTTLERLALEHSLPNANNTFNTSAIPVTLGTRPGHFTLDFSAPLTVPNRLVGQTKTIPGNILQCVPSLTSNAQYLPGQFPLSAIDGAESTRWQPAFANETAYLTVDLGADTAYYPIKDIRLDWGPTPPTSYAVYFSNVSIPLPPATGTGPGGPVYNISANGNVVNVTSSDSVPVNISIPYDAATASLIAPPMGNTTNVTLSESVWSGRYVTLSVQGNIGDSRGNATGPTVAEWSVLAEGGEKKVRMRGVRDSAKGRRAEMDRRGMERERERRAWERWERDGRAAVGYGRRGAARGIREVRRRGGGMRQL